MTETISKQHLLVHEIKNEHEYDPAQALRVWRLLQDEIPTEQWRSQGYREYDGMSDEDRIVSLFELLDGSIFGDMIFSDLANLSQGSTLIVRSEDE